MPVGNQQVWDKGIGEPATNMLMQSVQQQQGPSGFNPMALVQQQQPQQAQQSSAAGGRKFIVNGQTMDENEYWEYMKKIMPDGMVGTKSVSRLINGVETPGIQSSVGNQFSIQEKNPFLNNL